MKKSFNKRRAAISAIMLITAVIFIIYALNNPQASFPWGNDITYTIYALYLLAMTILFVSAFGKK